MAGDPAPSFLAETPAETAEFESVRDRPVEEAKTPPGVQPEAAEPKTAEPPKAAEPTKEPAKAEPAKPVEPPKVDERPKFVPHAALHEERLKRQALEKENAELKAGKVAEAEKPKEIDPEVDPIAALKEIRDYQKQQREEGERNNQLRNFDQRVQAHEKDFSDATPDYGAAVTFLREARAKQIVDARAAVGQPISQADLGAILMHEARTTANDALNNGRNPGEVFYILAKSFGYMGKAPEPPPEPPPAPKVEPPTKAAEETIDRLTRGHKAATKLPPGDPPETGGEMTLEKLANLEGAAFDKAFEKFSKAQRNVH